MDDLKLFAKNESQIELLVNTVQLMSKDIGMEFGVEKCGILSGKVKNSRGISFVRCWVLLRRLATNIWVY
jgi:hypothetical protein